MGIASKVSTTFGSKIRVRVCGICIQHEAILLINHTGLNESNEFWAPPGGGVELYENAEKALEREFKEETNLDITVGKFLFVNEVINDPLHAIELFFEVSLDNEDLKPGTDPEFSAKDQIIKSVQFVTFEELVVMKPENYHNVLHNVNKGNYLLKMQGYFKF